MMTAAGSVTRLGSALSYWADGPEEGPAVILTHGASLDHHSFDAQSRALAGAGYRVVSWDLRGHGCSVPLGSGFDLAILADDLGAVMDALGIRRAALVGHSFGGYIVQEFLRRHASRVTAIAIVASTDLSQKPPAAYRLMLTIMPWLLPRMSLGTFRRRTLAELSISDQVRAYAARAMEGIGKQDFTAIILAGIRCLAADYGYPAGYTIPVPFLLTHGELDRANGGVFPRQSPKWAARQPRCRYEVIPGAAHMAQMDNAPAFNRTLLRFLGEHTRGSGHQPREECR